MFYMGLWRSKRAVDPYLFYLHSKRFPLGFALRV